MNKTLVSLAAAAALVTGISTMGIAASAGAATPAIAATAKAPITIDTARTDGGVVEAGHRRGRRLHRRFGHNHSYLWKYDYRPSYVCKKRFRWMLTEYGWRNVYVGYWCNYTNNY